MTEPKGSWNGALKPRTVKSGTNSLTVSSSHAYLIRPMGRMWLQNHPLTRLIPSLGVLSLNKHNYATITYFLLVQPAPALI